MQRGDRDRALRELERARGLAPESATVALQLAAAYRKFGEISREEALLREQLKHTPDDQRVRTRLAELRAVQSPQPAQARVSGPLPAPAAASAAIPVTSASRASVTSQPEAVHAAPQRRALASRRPARSPAPESDITTELRSRFARALQTRRFDDAQHEADSLLARVGSVDMLDDLTYKLVDAGATDQAMRVLLSAYPFAGEAAAERDTLLQRLIPLIEAHQAGLGEEDLQRLRVPLDTPALRSRQAVLWTNLDECAVVRAVLGDMSAEYGHDDWMRLGDCSDDPKVARHAYTTAHALRPGGSGSRALGYRAHADGDYRVALDAWRSVDTERLLGDDALAAATTALAAGEPTQATTWLETYREHGEKLEHRYWSLVGQSRMGSDPTAAIVAFERAVALQPDLDDYLRLSRLDGDPTQQVHWLERAVELDRANADIQAELGYAYGRAGRPASALRAFERSASLNPASVTVQIELGFAYWRAGRSAHAQRALEWAWRTDPTNLMVARQLVYVNQRLKHNDEARRYAERVLDATSSFSEASADENAVEQADLRFGFQRLHEDLGRRLTVNLDGSSGTHVGTGTRASQPGSRYSSYSQLEADLRLGAPAIRDGSTVSAYARVFADGGELRSALPSRNAMLGAGLRWKPWRSQIIYLAAEHQNGLDDRGRRDVLLRASASFFNGGRYGDDWHPARNGWFSRNLYLDAAQYVQTNRSAFTADYRTSYHRRVADGQTLEPYAHVQFNGAESKRLDRDVRAGVGLRWNVWHGGTPYDADPHKLSLGVEFQQAFETYLPDRNGVFLTLGSRW
jgi:adsorption protein A